VDIRYVDKNGTVKTASANSGLTEDVTFTAGTDKYKEYFSPENRSITVQGVLSPNTTSESKSYTVLLIPIYKAGDLNGDGSVNETDAKMLLKHLSGISPLTSEQRGRAYVNNDARIDMLDVLTILDNMS
ncbi:MAG: dockerin type I repeat-containing protein, partial [Firmicutes bacterium]|nr:dockerin type I repeat-containing protein [Bacillota bacterium]